MNTPGKLIVFEGLDGCGKSTQIKLLREALATNGRNVQMLREPGGTPAGEDMRHILKHSTHHLTAMTELLLMNASRAQLVGEIIRPALARGEDILLDRFFYSTLAYQGYGRQLPLAEVRAVIQAATGGLQPDHVFLLKISLEECLRRRMARQSALPFFDIDRFEAEEVEFFSRVSRGYDEVASAEPQRIHVVNGIGTVEEIHAKIKAHL